MYRFFIIIFLLFSSVLVFSKNIPRVIPGVPVALLESKVDAKKSLEKYHIEFKEYDNSISIPSVISGGTKISNIIIYFYHDICYGLQIHGEKKDLDTAIYIINNMVELFKQEGYPLVDEGLYANKTVYNAVFNDGRTMAVFVLSKESVDQNIVMIAFYDTQLYKEQIYTNP